MNQSFSLDDHRYINNAALILDDTFLLFNTVSAVIISDDVIYILREHCLVKGFQLITTKIVLIFILFCTSIFN